MIVIVVRALGVETATISAGPTDLFTGTVAWSATHRCVGVTAAPIDDIGCWLFLFLSGRGAIYLGQIGIPIGNTSCRSSLQSKPINIFR